MELAIDVADSLSIKQLHGGRITLVYIEGDCIPEFADSTRCSGIVEKNIDQPSMRRKRQQTQQAVTLFRNDASARQFAKCVGKSKNQFLRNAKLIRCPSQEPAL